MTFGTAKANKVPQVPSIGRIVHYVLAKVDCEKMEGKSRPGIIVSVGDERDEPVNLQVFTNGGHDDLPPVHWKRDVSHNEDRKPGTWHWPPRDGAPPFTKPAESIEELKKQLEVSRSRDDADRIEKAIQDVQAVPVPTLEHETPEQAYDARDPLPDTEEIPFPEAEKHE